MPIGGLQSRRAADRANRHILTRLVTAVLLAVLGALPVRAQAPPPTSPALTSWAMEQVKARNYDAALKATGERIRAAPDDGAAVFLRGAIASRMGFHAAAATIFDAYARAGGRHPSLALEWGIALMRTGRFGAAAEKFEVYRKANPKWPYVHILQGQALLGSGKPADAERSFKRARDERETRPMALVHLAALEHLRNKPDKVTEYLKELFEKHAETLEAKAIAILAQGMQQAGR